MFGRPLITLLQCHSQEDHSHHRELLERRNEEMKEKHDKTSRKTDLPPLYKGQSVRILDRSKKNLVSWYSGSPVPRATELRSTDTEWQSSAKESCKPAGDGAQHSEAST